MDFSLLETMRLNEGTIVRLERHLSSTFVTTNFHP